jgi:hypothetical protein
MNITKKQKVLTANELLDYLLELKDYDVDLNKVTLHYREDDDSDVMLIEGVCEDLFDAETNSVLESLLFYTKLND